MKIKEPSIKAAVILIPTYTVAFLTEAMVYTIPMLAVSTIFAHSMFDDDVTVRRTDEEDIGKESREE